MTGRKTIAALLFQMVFSERLKKNEDFRTVYREGRSVADRNLVIYVRKNDTETSRIGISVSKKTGNSVKRHLFKRRIREIYRLRETELPKGRDYVVIARTGAPDCDYDTLLLSFDHLMRKFK